MKTKEQKKYGAVKRALSVLKADHCVTLELLHFVTEFIRDVTVGDPQVAAWALFGDCGLRVEDKPPRGDFAVSFAENAVTVRLVGKLLHFPNQYEYGRYIAWSNARCPKTFVPVAHPRIEVDYSWTNVFEEMDSIIRVYACKLYGPESGDLSNFRVNIRYIDNRIDHISW